MCSSSESSRFLTRKTTEESSRNMKSGWLFKGGVRLIEIIFCPKTNDYITTGINSKCQWKKMGGEREGMNSRCPFLETHRKWLRNNKNQRLVLRFRRLSVCVAWIPRKRLRNNKDQCLVPRLLMKVSVLKRLTESDWRSTGSCPCRRDSKKMTE